MKNQNEYNGWTNYATWRINLELFSDMDVEDYFDEFPDVDELKDYAENVIFENYHGTLGLVEDYARAFFSNVNWWEIVDHMKDEYEHNKKLENEN